MRVSATKVRLPDVVIDRVGAHPQILTTPPLIASEILSPSDTFADILERFAEIFRMGVLHIWLIDPEKRTGHVYGEGGLLAPATRFEVTSTPIYLDLPEIFAAIDEDNA